ncbi:MAG: hypothetical protein HQL07_12475, partial [Nitrospirae bacterium]|nr:hypothetical protein [Magnetococcales bacterium]
MAVADPMLFAVEGTRQAAQLSALSGKSFVVGQVSSAGNGLMGNWMFLQPVGDMGAAAAKKTVAIKLEGARQMASLSSLTGKTVTVAKTPVTVGGACNWLALHPATGGAAAVGGAASGSASSGLVMVKLEGARQAAQLTGLSGQTFTVVPSPMMGGKGAGWMFLQPSGGGGKLVALKVQANAGSATASSLVGKSFVLGKGSLAAKGGSAWVMFKPAGSAVMAKGGACIAAAAGGANCVTPTAQTVAFTPAAPAAAKAAGTTAGVAGNAPAALSKTGTAVAGKSAAVKAAGGGVLWKGVVGANVQ